MQVQGLLRLMDQLEMYVTVDGIVQFDEHWRMEQVTPDMAMGWIAASWGQNGRQFYPTKVEKIRQYAELMRAGEWKFHPNARIEIRDGILTGGKHRCHAVLLSGVTIPSMVLYKNRRLKEQSNGS